MKYFNSHFLFVSSCIDILLGELIQHGNGNLYYTVKKSMFLYSHLVEPDPVLKCKSFGDNTCGNNHECCSLNCYKEHSWKLGVCKKASDHVLKYGKEDKSTLIILEATIYYICFYICFKIIDYQLYSQVKCIYFNLSMMFYFL